MIGYLDSRGGAEFLSHSVRWIRKNLHRLPHYRVGGKILFDPVQLRRWVESHAEPHVDVAAIVDKVAGARRARDGRRNLT
jgi:hypothetical protein